MATTLDQKVLGGIATICCALVIQIPPGQQQTLNPADFTDGTWKPRIAPLRGQRPVKVTYGGALGSRKKQRSGCNGSDTGFTLPGTKVYPRPTGLTSRENWRDRYEEEKQMTAAGSPKTGTSSRVIHWDIINWRAIEQYVLRLQMRIAKATRGRRCGKVKCISRDLI